MGGHGPFSGTDHSRAFGPRHPVEGGCSGPDGGPGISVAGSSASPRPCRGSSRDPYVRRTGLARTALRISGPTASARGRAIHAAVLPAHDGIARALHAV